MKRIIVASLLLLPCIAIFNGGENIIINIFGIAYASALWQLSKSRKGQVFLIRLYKEKLRIDKKIFRQ